MQYLVILAAVAVLAYANGANDNFKGVATLLGSGTTHFRVALLWATGTTFVGSLLAVVLAEQLLKRFSGKGIVAESLVADPQYAAAVGLGAGLTVLLATRLGLPISTTHGLVGGLVGAGWAAGGALNLSQLGTAFLLPLLTTPLLAIVLTALCFLTFRWVRVRLGVTESLCLCVGNETVEVVPLTSPAVAQAKIQEWTVRMGDTASCQRQYQGTVLGVDAASVLDRLHFLSAGGVSLARGLNDTPKIAALLLLVPALGAWQGRALVGVVIAVGGLLSARRVAETVSHRITQMNHGQGFTANAMTCLIGIGASLLAAPVSTTHVSCGALFGIGAVTGQARLKMIATILLAWAVTLPAAAVLSAICYRLLAG